mmetsp:Transcript_87446/g.222733  ORF Transcript_87446/g.222733 Transcript_87446/m.222733 type:complete len:231 (+) Transcript_87446:100-792(+)
MVDLAVRALSCCCIVSDHTDANQISYPLDNLGFEEGHLAQPLHLPPSGVGQFGRPSLGRVDSIEQELLSARTAASAPSTARSLSPEERQKEKERLQDMVKEFAKAVVQGQQCQLLPQGMPGAPQSATYSFDKALRNFSVHPDDATPLTLEMAQVSEIMKDVRSTPFAEALRLPHSLAGEELDRRFACVQYEAGGKMEYVGLLLPNPHERERFYTCMKILRWAMESRRERT